MIRRSFRIGLWLGLLVGIGVAVAKIFRPKPEQSFAPSAREWTPLEPSSARPASATAPVVSTPAPAPVPPPAVEAPSPPPPAPVASAPAPVVETPAPVAPAAAPAATPVDKPVEKKPAVKKPAPAKKASAAKKTPAAPAAPPAPAKKVLAQWVDPDGNICPQTHPVKAKLSSRIFQVPGNFAYERTKPDRCYESADAAANDGLRAAKR